MSGHSCDQLGLLGKYRLPPVPATAPDLLLRTFEPPPVQVRNTDLGTLLAPAYDRLAAPAEPADG